MAPIPFRSATRPFAVLAVLVVLSGGASVGCRRTTPAPGANDAADMNADAGDSSLSQDTEPEVVAGAQPLITTDGEALRPALEGDLLAFLSIEEGGTACLSVPWREECVTRVRLVDLSDQTPVFWSDDINGTSVPGLADGVLYWAGPDNRLRYHHVGGVGVVHPLEDDPDYYGIQGSFVVQDGGIHWYAYDYTAASTAFQRYDLTTGEVTLLLPTQHDRPYFVDDLGAPSAPQFDISDRRLVWLQHMEYGSTWHYRIVQATIGEDATAPEALPTGDVNCLWPRIRGSWVYYIWYLQEHWECRQYACIFHLSRVHLETGEVEELTDEAARITGLSPPLLWDGGAGWLDFRDGTYRVVLKPEGGEPVAATPVDRPVGLFTGVSLVPRDDDTLQILWSTLHEGRLQIFSMDWTGEGDDLGRAPGLE